MHKLRNQRLVAINSSAGTLPIDKFKITSASV